MGLIDLIVSIGKSIGWIPMEIAAAIVLITTGITGYVGTKGSTDIVEVLVNAGSLAFIFIGAVGILTAIIQSLYLLR